MSLFVMLLALSVQCRLFLMSLFRRSRIFFPSFHPGSFASLLGKIKLLIFGSPLPLLCQSLLSPFFSAESSWLFSARRCLCCANRSMSFSMDVVFVTSLALSMVPNAVTVFVFPNTSFFSSREHLIFSFGVLRRWLSSAVYRA